MPNGITQIGNYAFHACTSLIKINIPDSITKSSISDNAFLGCVHLCHIDVSDETYQRLFPQIVRCDTQRTKYGGGDVRFRWQWNIFSNIVYITYPQCDFRDDYINIEFDNALKSTAPWFRQIAMEISELVEEKTQEVMYWRRSNRCQYCGGLFEGFFTKTCKQCGKIKDY